MFFSYVIFVIFVYRSTLIPKQKRRLETSGFDGIGVTSVQVSGAGMQVSMHAGVSEGQGVSPCFFVFCSNVVGQVFLNSYDIEDRVPVSVLKAKGSVLVSLCFAATLSDRYF
jgi:hypothetical protein